MPLRKRGAATTKNQCEKSSARTRCWRPSLPSRDVPGDFLDASRPVWLRETTRRASAIPGGEVTDKKGRWQCRYSEGAVRIREQKKYDRVVAFGRALPSHAPGHRSRHAAARAAAREGDGVHNAHSLYLLHAAGQRGLREGERQLRHRHVAEPAAGQKIARDVRET